MKSVYESKYWLDVAYNVYKELLDKCNPADLEDLNIDDIIDRFNDLNIKLFAKINYPENLMLN